MTLIIWKAVVFLLVLGVLIFVHEFGHFIVAKLCRVGVLRFSLGFGPSLFRFRKGETEYQLSAIPLGGYVRMVGDMPDMITGPQLTDQAVREGEGHEVEEFISEGIDENLPPQVKAMMRDESRWFIHKGFWARSAIVFAGPFFNLLLAIALVSSAAFIYGEHVPDERAVIGDVAKGSPAQEAGLQAGDLVQTLDGAPVSGWVQLAQSVHDGSGKPITFKVLRAGTEQLITVQPQKKKLMAGDGTRKDVFVVGIEPKVDIVEIGLGRALIFGPLWTADTIVQTTIGLWGMVSGKISPDDLAGPVFIYQVAGKQAEKGLKNLLYFIAVLSVSLAVLNLLPIPILDGGHLLFFIVEAIIGPISVRKKEMAQQFGFLLLMFLIIFVIKNDLVRDEADLSGKVKWDKTEDAQPQQKDAEQNVTERNVAE